MIDAWGWEAVTYWWSVPVEKSLITVDGRARRERESPAGAALSGGDGRRTNLMGWTGTGRARSGVKSSGRSWDLCRHCDLYITRDDPALWSRSSRGGREQGNKHTHRERSRKSCTRLRATPWPISIGRKTKDAHRASSNSALLFLDARSRRLA